MPETEEKLCGYQTHMMPLRELLRYWLGTELLSQELFSLIIILLNVLKQPALSLTRAEKKWSIK